MATRAVTPRKSTPDWRAAFRRSVRRTVQMTGAGALLLLMFFLAAALITYTQTDPSPSTAASGEEVGNIMGLSGAWAADRVLFFFGIPGVLLLPLLYISARKLWRDVEQDDDIEAPLENTVWWRPFFMLILAMVLMATTLTLAFDTSGGTLPAQIGGVSGLLGAGTIQALSTKIAGDSAGWLILIAALASLAGSVALLTRIFAIDWRALLTLPEFLGGGALVGGAVSGALAKIPFIVSRQPRLAAPEAGVEEIKEGTPPAKPTTAKRAPVVEETPRRAPEISDPSAPPRRAAAAKANQKDMFADFDLPSLDLLAEPPADAKPSLDKLALERNARLLENVLDDFNVKGEITAVRTGPVVTMYELEPAPGIRSNRVVGLAEDIARNICARFADRVQDGYRHRITQCRPSDGHAQGVGRLC